MYSDPAGHFIISALIAGAVTSAIVSALVDAAVITAAVVVVGMAVSATIDYVNDYQKQKAEEKENIKQQYDDNSPRIHHIVAKAAYKAEPAREVLKDNEINVVTDTHNLVVIPHRFHKSMHTNRYYEYVNKRIEPCNSKEEVYAALDQLSLEIQTAAATGVIPWA